ncbi:DUF2721 domain-containing protein [Pseudochryseolinea flava]|uniref:DUF2721 domain-containing protein n=1 Tax=Pseudochryseolinea flava TaxID=2059302 RepID=A0A364YAN9_9BACT|nr:DUF2721 domain-containing protein [Pseudochryseolinea flava]RAW02918.1 hypothetical protein DQQ10_02080 [Pseudochryseolinea flava]
MNDATPMLGILSSMITPAVLILASGSLIMTTSQRLSRVIERVRKISEEFMKIEKSSDKESDNERKRRILYTLLRKSARRSKLLTRAMTTLYLSLGIFISTSLAIGIVSITHIRFTWIPTALGLIGSVFLFFSAAVLIVESRLTYSAITDEVDYVIESSKNHAPELMKKSVRRNWRAWLKM